MNKLFDLFSVIVSFTIKKLEIAAKKDFLLKKILIQEDGHTVAEYDMKYGKNCANHKSSHKSFLALDSANSEKSDKNPISDISLRYPGIH